MGTNLDGHKASRARDTGSGPQARISARAETVEQARARIAPLEAEIRRRIDERAAAKKARNFARADEIRDELLAKGITLLDKAEGTVWRRA